MKSVNMYIHRKPILSIIIPVRDGQYSQLIKTLKSILMQKNNRLEVIAVSFGENSKQIEKIIKDNNYKCRCCFMKNNSIGDAIKYGIGESMGEYTTWMLCGSELLPGAAKTLLGVLGRSSNIDRNIIVGACLGMEKTAHKESGVYFATPEDLVVKNQIQRSIILFKKNDALLLNSWQNNDLFNYHIVQEALNKDFVFDFIGKEVAKLEVEPEEMSDSDVGLLDGFVLNFIKSINEKRRIEIAGSSYNFIVQNLLSLKKLNLKKTVKYLEESKKISEQKILDGIKSRKSKVTIITPLYNNRHYITETMESIYRQTFKDFTYIILDDGSSDNSGEVVSRYINDKCNFFYLYHDNIGEAKTVNIGWSLCNSEYFTQLNSDDYAEPDLFAEMVAGLDDNIEHVVAYSGFNIINADGKVIEKVLNQEFNLLDDLPKFNCLAATPGAFIRKAAFKDWKEIKDGNYKYINDIKMLWNMALDGRFLYIPKYLAAWRSHSGGISADRYKSCSEIEKWTDEFFAQKNLPNEVKAIESITRSGIYNYLAMLMEKSNLINRLDMADYYKQKAELPMPAYSNLQVGDNDLIGNKFNGHDLHINLRDLNVDASHLVWNKESDDPNTYIIAGGHHNRQFYRDVATAIREHYKLDYIDNHLMCEIMYNKMFLDADVVHFHLMHNGLLDFTFLPLASRLKPLVWTVHDSWIISGDPIVGNDEGYFFPTGINDMSVSYEIKSAAIKESNITYIANSYYTKKMLESSEMFKGKKIIYVPFGINLDTFKPKNKSSLRKKYGVKRGDIVLMARGSGGERKGCDYVEYVLENLVNEYNNIHLIVVGSSGSDLTNLPEGIKVTTYDWIKDDLLLSDLYNLSDLFLMPSRREYFGMMAMESMACGTLPLVIEGTSLTDTINAPKHGVATARNKQKYLEAVKYFIDHKAEREKRASACVDYVRKNHDVKNYVRTIDNIYKEAIKEHSISESDKILLKNLKANYEIMPVSNRNFELNNMPKMKRLLKKTKHSLKNEGMRITSLKIAKKIYKKTRFIIRGN